MLERGHKHASTQAALFKSGYLPPDHFDEAELMSPLYYGGSEPLNVETCVGSEHLPSLIFERLGLHDVLPALNESLHREALLCHPTPSLFGHTPSETSTDQTRATELASLLHGRDVPFPKIHADQGHGTFELARIHLWASSSPEHVGAVLNGTSAWSEVLKTCLLWDATPWSGIGSALEASTSIKHYTQVVHHLLEARCFGRINHQVRLGLSPNSALHYPKWRLAFDKVLAGVVPQDRDHTVQFHDLPERLMWMFLQFSQEGETPWSVLKAAFYTAEYAVEKHQRLLRACRAKHAEIETRLSLETVESVLKRKGPCKLRDLQRSTNNLHVSRLRPGLELLQQQGRLVIDEQNRYVLNPAGN